SRLFSRDERGRLPLLCLSEPLGGLGGRCSGLRKFSLDRRDTGGSRGANSTCAFDALVLDLVGERFPALRQAGDDRCRALLCLDREPLLLAPRELSRGARERYLDLAKVLLRLRHWTPPGRWIVLVRHRSSPGTSWMVGIENPSLSWAMRATASTIGTWFGQLLRSQEWKCPIPARGQTALEPIGAGSPSKTIV